jgi:hypothetical protein
MERQGSGGHLVLSGQLTTPTILVMVANRLGVISESTSSPTVLHLRTRIPISERNQVQYTYRLLYPSGRIEWLGGYERDGVLVFKRQDPALTRGIAFDSHAGEGTFFSGQDSTGQCGNHEA